MRKKQWMIKKNMKEIVNEKRKRKNEGGKEKRKNESKAKNRVREEKGNGKKDAVRWDMREGKKKIKWMNIKRKIIEKKEQCKIYVKLRR